MALMSCANLLSPFVVTAVVVLYLDEACFNHWKSWWEQCTRKTLRDRMFDVFQSGYVPGHFEAHVLASRDVCSRTGGGGASACARSKMQQQDHNRGAEGIGILAVLLACKNHPIDSNTESSRTPSNWDENDTPPCGFPLISGGAPRISYPMA